MKQELVQKQKLPEGWRCSTLGDIFIFGTKTGLKAGEGIEKGTYKFFTSSEKQIAYINQPNFNGEYLIFSTGGKAALHYINEKFSASNDCFVIKIKDNIDTKYVFYYLKSNINILEDGFKGAGLKHISKEYLKNIKILYPENKKVQRQIVSKLDKQMAQIEIMKKEAEKENEKTDMLFDSYLLRVFEKLTDSKDLGSLINTIQNGIYKPEHFRKKGIKLVRMYNIDANSIIMNDKDLQEIELSDEENKNFTLEKEDVLLSRVNSAELVGKCGVVEDNLQGFAFENMIIRIKTNKQKLIPKYLGYFFLSSIGKNEIRKITRLAINQASINNKDVKTLRISLPFSLKEQEIIVKDLSEKYKITYELKKNLVVNLDALNRLPSSILNEVFGKYEILEVG